MVEDKGVTIFVDPTSVMFILGTEMDFQEDKYYSVLPNIVRGKSLRMRESFLSLLSVTSRAKTASTPLGNLM